MNRIIRRSALVFATWFLFELFVMPPFGEFGTSGQAGAQQSPVLATENPNPNLLQNGDASMDARNEGNAVTLPSTGSPTMTADRWQGVFNPGTSNAGLPTVQRVPTSAGFTLLPNELKVTTGTIGSVTSSNFQLALQEQIEGSDMADLQFGTPNAGPTTYTIWLKSSVANATYSVALQNATQTRSLIGTCSVVTNGAWTLCTGQFGGDIAGTWNNAPGTIGAIFSVQLACGPGFQGTVGVWQNGNLPCAPTQTALIQSGAATLEMTAVKLERGTGATPFFADPQPIAFSKSRHWYRKTFPTGVVAAAGAGLVGSVCTYAGAQVAVQLVVDFMDQPMFSAPVTTLYNPLDGSQNWRDVTHSVDLSTIVQTPSVTGVGIASGTAPAMAAGDQVCIQASFDTGK